jgi:biotin carboxylase
MAHAARKLLLVELGGQMKAFLLEKLIASGIELYLAAGDPEEWCHDYFTSDRIIHTDPYNSVQLLSDVLVYMELENCKFDAVGTFWEHAVTQTADLAAALGLPGISPGAARRSSANKLLMHQVCLQGGVKVPAQHVFRGLHTLHNHLSEVSLPAVIKPVFGDDSFGVMKIECNTGEEAIQAIIAECRKTWSPASPAYKNFRDVWLLQNFVEGKLISVDGIIKDGHIHFAGLVEIGMGPEPRFTQSANWLPPRISASQSGLCSEVATRAITCLGLDHCGFHCELRLPPIGKPVLIEIAGRLPGGLIPKAYELAYGLDLASAMADVWFGNTVDLRASLQAFVVQKGVFPEGGGVLESVDGFELVCQLYPDVRFHQVLKPGDNVVTYPNVPKPIYVYTAVAPSADGREELANQIEQTVKFKIGGVAAAADRAVNEMLD